MQVRDGMGLPYIWGSAWNLKRLARNGIKLEGAEQASRARNAIREDTLDHSLKKRERAKVGLVIAVS